MIKDYQAIWFDKRKNIELLRPSTALGFILNVPNGSRLTGWMPSALVSNKHWIALRKIGDELYFNLNSQLAEPEVIGDVSQNKEGSRMENEFFYFRKVPWCSI